MFVHIPKELNSIVLFYITLSAVSVSAVSASLHQQNHNPYYWNHHLLNLHANSPSSYSTKQAPHQQHRAASTSTKDDDDHKMANPNSLNVFQNPLAFFSTTPLTGFMRNGYCEVPASDFGNHSVAAELTEEFLDYTMEQGNDLRQIGLKGGCKWCICAGRWQEALQAHRDGKIGEKAVPKVWLEATNRRALEKVDFKDLKGFALDRKE